MKISEIITERAETEHDAYNNLRQALQLVVRDCQPFLTDIQWNSPYLLRGMRKRFDFKKITTRTNRKPTDTPIIMQQAADKWFMEQFGYPFRSAGIFTTGSELSAEDYGWPFVVFPVGQYQYTWSPNINLLFNKMDRMYQKLSERSNDGEISFDVAYNELSNFLSNAEYTDTNINAAIRSGNEVLIGASEYYALNPSILSYANILGPDVEYFIEDIDQILQELKQ